MCNLTAGNLSKALVPNRFEKLNRLHKRNLRIRPIFIRSLKTPSEIRGHGGHPWVVILLRQASGFFRICPGLFVISL